MKDPVQRSLFKAAMVLFTVELALSFIVQVLRSVSTWQLIVACAAVSLIVYFVRQSRHPPNRRIRSGSTGERNPMMPRTRP